MKTKELREQNKEELVKQVEDLRSQLVKSRVAKANQQLKNPLKLRTLKREIARILTILGEKE